MVTAGCPGDRPARTSFPPCDCANDEGELPPDRWFMTVRQAAARKGSRTHRGDDITEGISRHLGNIDHSAGVRRGYPAGEGGEKSARGIPFHRTPARPGGREIHRGLGSTAVPRSPIGRPRRQRRSRSARPSRPVGRGPGGGTPAHVTGGKGLSQVTTSSWPPCRRGGQIKLQQIGSHIDRSDPAIFCTWKRAVRAVAETGLRRVGNGLADRSARKRRCGVRCPARSI